MMGWLIALLAGTITGILSAFGIGGGSLLLIYLTSFAAIDQHQAQGINLLYFLPAAAASPPQAWSSGQKGDPPRDFSGLGRRRIGCLAFQQSGHRAAAKTLWPLSSVCWPAGTLSQGPGPV